jgi:hypothetical protein
MRARGWWGAGALCAVALTMPAAPAPAASGFTPRIANPYFPAEPGMRWVYRGTEDGGKLRNVVRVADKVEIVDGVPCAVIVDKVFIDGRLRESTHDWYTQDAGGTVWYYGEATKTFDAHGHVDSTEGSWRAGVQGARPGIYMPAKPKVGDAFEQEHFPGHAEDHFKILTKRATVRVPYGTFRHRALKTKEWTPLEPGVRDGKWYVRGIGQVREASLRGGHDLAELVTFRKG